MYRTFTALLLGVALSQPVLAVQPPVVLLEHMDNEVLALSIDKKELQRDPVWQPGQGSVPFTTDKLIQTLNRWAKTSYPRFQSIAIQEIILKPIESPAYGTHWHYLVAFKGIVDGQVQNDKTLVAAVLFDGKVIPGVVEPRP
jgi:hypothetical protein